MASEDSYKASEIPSLCANGCGFYATATTDNLCSKCCRLKQEHRPTAASAEASVDSSRSSSSPPPPLSLPQSQPTIPAVSISGGLKTQQENQAEQEDTRSKIMASNTSSLCANGCGFHGTATTDNLCSKCYRLKQEHRLKEASAEASVDSSLSSSSPPPPPLSPQFQGTTPAVSISGVVGYGTKNKCECCKKKVRTLGFKCRCGGTFCSEHRYPEMHACTFDFKSVGRNAIAKANPVIKPDKIQRF